MMEKVLWVVSSANLDDLLSCALSAAVTGIALRTTMDIDTALKKFAGTGIAIFGWRWPSADESCMDEAARAVKWLSGDLAGYFIDAEDATRKPGAHASPYNWNLPGKEAIAKQLCMALKRAAPKKPLGFTSHMLATKNAPNLPWSTFLKYADVNIPQAYWRTSEGTVVGGDPAKNYKLALDAWTKLGANETSICPMGGEINLATPAQIAAYATSAKAKNCAMHFYCDTDITSLHDEVITAIANA